MLGILILLIGATSLKYIHVYILFSFLIPFSFDIIKLPIFRISFIALFNLIFFYTVGIIVESELSKDFSDEIIYMTGNDSLFVHCSFLFLYFLSPSRTKIKG